MAHHRSVAAALVALFSVASLVTAATPRANSVYTPPACQAPGPFADVPHTSPFCPWIQKLAEDGITAGCGNGNFCPDAPITRAQAAVFLELAMRGTDSWTPAENPFGSTILVKGNGTAEENGALLRETLESTVGQLNVWTTVQLEQGTFDIGSETLTVREYVILRGAGRLATKIVGGGSAAQHVLIEASEGSRLERLWLHDRASSASNIVVEAHVTSGLSEVLIIANGAGKEVIGVREFGGGGRFEVNDVAVYVVGSPATGIVLIDDWESILNRLRVDTVGQLDSAALRLDGVVTLADSSISYNGSAGEAIEVRGGGVDMARCEVAASNNLTAIKVPSTGGAVYLKNSRVFGQVDLAGGTFELRDSTLTGYEKASFSGNSTAQIIESQIEVGIVLSDAASLEVDRSTLKGFYGIENGSSNTVRIGSSKIANTTAPAGYVKCAASYDANFDMLGSDCQPLP